MGAVQKLATVVIVGLVALATVLTFYLADESNRIKAEENAQEHDAIERATSNYISLCLACHGPAGEGLMAPGESGTGRIGLPLGGDTYATKLNQQGIQSDGSPVPGGVNARATVIAETIREGRVAAGMPAWGEAFGGPLNDAQVEEMVLLIQHGDWNEVYNQAVEASHGYPTANPTDPRKTPTPEEGGASATATPSGGQTGGSESIEVELVDIAFNPTELTIPANTDVTVNLTNSGAATHNFTIESEGITSGDYAGGQTGSLTLNLPPGEYEYVCTIPGHKEAGMVGILRVEEGAAVPANEEPAGEQEPAPTEGAAAPTDGGGQALEVDMVDIAFNPKEITIPANTDVTINLVNNGAATHNFTIESEGLSSGDYVGGQTGTLTVNLPPGEYEYVCTIPGHKEAGMVGKLIVQ